MFEKASRLKLRFNHRGVCTTEDLWDLSIEDLDSMYISINKSLKEAEGESLLKKTSVTYDALKLKIDVITHIVRTKQEEYNNAENDIIKKQRKGFLLRMKNEKENASLSIEDINKELSGL